MALVPSLRNTPAHQSSDRQASAESDRRQSMKRMSRSEGEERHAKHDATGEASKRMNGPSLQRTERTYNGRRNEH
jgi:hypothetical protein